MEGGRGGKAWTRLLCSQVGSRHLESSLLQKYRAMTKRTCCRVCRLPSSALLPRVPPRTSLCRRHRALAYRVARRAAAWHAEGALQRFLMHTGVLRGLLAEAESLEFNGHPEYDEPLLGIDWEYWQEHCLRCSLVPCLLEIGELADQDGVGVRGVSFALPSRRLR